MNPGKCPPAEGKQGHRAQSSRRNSAAAPGAHQQCEDRSHNDENQKIGSGNQPHEMAAHPVKTVHVNKLLPHDHGHDFDKPRAEPAPGRQHQKWQRPTPVCGEIFLRAARASLLQSRSRHRHGSIAIGISIGGVCIVATLC